MQVRNSFSDLNADRVSRADLGTLAIPEAGQALQTAKLRLEVYASVSDCLLGRAGDQFLEDLDALGNELRNITTMLANQLAAQRNEVFNNLEQLELRFHKSWPYIVAVAIEKSNLLLSDKFETQTEASIGRLTTAAEATQERLQTAILGLEGRLNNSVKGSEDRLQDALRAAEMRFNETSDRVLAAAKAEAEKIEIRARETAKEVSVGAAQDQFNSAQKIFRIKAAIWSVLTVLAFAGLFGYANHLFNQASATISSEPIQELIYKSVLRLTIITGIGAVATFFLRMTRAHFHMLEQNSHRRRVANSMVAFIDAAMTREQRDLILGKLVESVVDFGDPGILDRDKDSVTGPTVAIEALTKTFMQKGA